MNATSKAHARRRPPEPGEIIPANIEAERTLLGYYLVGGAWRNEIGARHFHDEKHKEIWHAMASIHSTDGDPITQQRVATELGETKLRSVSVGYLIELGEGCFPEMRIDPYVGKLHDVATKREIFHHAHILQLHVQAGDRSAAELVDMGMAAFATLHRGQNHLEPPPVVATWPDPIDEAGFHGIAGELVHAIEPHTEADNAALLLQFLVAWGSLVGRGPYVLAENDRHHTNLYAVIVGTTSKGRKGTSWSRVRGVLATVDEHWVGNCLLSGLGSGEALIDALGSEDHRRLVHESEFARLLAIIAREGTTVSSIFRQCWDSGEAHVTVRMKEAHVTGGHLSLVGHITRDELLRRLSDIEIVNGFGNRILWGCARRSKELPFGGDSIKFGDMPFRLQQATEFARKAGDTRFQFDEDAKRLWEGIYHNLSEGRPGLFGAATGRGEAQVLRLSLVYALLDRSDRICVEHLRAALALWRYCEDSARFIYRDSLGDPTADAILAALRTAGELGLTRWDISNHFGRNKPAEELDRAIGVLAERGLIRSANEETGGRSRTRYCSV